MMHRKEFSRKYNGQISELSKIIKSFDLIPNASSNEFDSLSHQILSRLEKGIDSEKLYAILKNELIIVYGLWNDEFDTEPIVSELMDWWNSNK